jgi:hypothetical protein
LTEIESQAERFFPAERAEMQAQIDWYVKYDPRDMPIRTVVPSVKQFIISLAVDVNNRIWVRRTGVSIKSAEGIPLPKPNEPPLVTYKEPWIFDGFTAEGDFLGEVRFPSNIVRVSIANDIAWAIVTNVNDEQSLVRFRLPAGQ